ncbi:hypothetical protein LCGC14_1026920 [marine sediment metagenome]|uniref:Uncharacterized protein n=1 Tax=marine sediment metagenome TaxID=412755 RepID=A0A0F9MVT8_9ZZZZ
MTNLKAFVANEDFSGGAGLPTGDTILDLTTTQVSPEDYEGKPRWKLTTADKVEYFVPKTVMNGIKNAVAKDFGFARVTRTGESKNDTQYTVVGIKDGGQ